MWRTRWLHYVMLFILGAGALAVFVALVTPTTTAIDNFQITDSDETVVLHQFLDGLATASPVLPIFISAPTVGAFAWPSLSEAPRAILVVRATAPRAPPVLP